MILPPATPITVRDRDGHPARERVLHHDNDDRIFYSWGDTRFVLGAAGRGIVWELGWDTEEAQAFAAQLLLQAS